jgi:hypothetical protein
MPLAGIGDICGGGDGYRAAIISARAEKSARNLETFVSEIQ